MRLAEPKTRGEMSLEETLVRRRSKRRFSPRKLTWEQISQLLWAGQGLTEAKRGFRTAPSAGATFPLELYAVTAEGAFHYHTDKHELEKVLASDIRLSLSGAALRQRSIEEAPLSIVVAAVYQRVGATYGPRAERYTHIEVGHAAQNIHLQAEALGSDQCLSGPSVTRTSSECSPWRKISNLFISSQ